MAKIKNNLKVVQDRKNIYVGKSRIEREFKEVYLVFLKVNPNKILFMLGICTNMASIFYGPFEILYRKVLVAYMLALLDSMNVHNSFHVHFLKKYVHDINHVID